MKSFTIGLLLSACSVSFAASAEEKSTPKPTVKAYKVPETIIYGRRQKPNVAVMVSRIEPKLSITQTDLRVLKRIESAVVKSPF
jgi:hypothetical protein